MGFSVPVMTTLMMSEKKNVIRRSGEDPPLQRDPVLLLSELLSLASGVDLKSFCNSLHQSGFRIFLTDALVSVCVYYVETM